MHRRRRRDCIPREMERFPLPFHPKFGSGGRSGGVGCHGRDGRHKCRTGIEVRAKPGEQPLHIVQKETGAEEGVTTQSQHAAHRHLARDDVEIPILFRGRKEIDAESGNDAPRSFVLFPVGKEGIEVTPVKIHHREEPVHPTFCEPRLSVLTHGVAGVPSERRGAGKVGIFPDGRATEFDPGAHALDRIGDRFHTAVHVLLAPSRLGESGWCEAAKVGIVAEGNRVFGIANIV